MRYEGQVKQRQQKELAESIINKIMKELDNPKTLQQILNQSVADVESKSVSQYVYQRLINVCRDRIVKSPIDFLAVVHKLLNMFQYLTAV